MRIDIKTKEEEGEDVTVLRSDLTTHKEQAKEQQTKLLLAEQLCAEEGPGSDTRTICIDLQ